MAAAAFVCGWGGWGCCCCGLPCALPPPAANRCRRRRSRAHPRTHAPARTHTRQPKKTGKPIFESSHVTTGLIGLSLLAFQAMLPLFFAESPGTRTVVSVLVARAVFFMGVGAGRGGGRCGRRQRTQHTPPTTTPPPHTITHTTTTTNHTPPARLPRLLDPGALRRARRPRPAARPLALSVLCVRARAPPLARATPKHSCL